ncbi:MAG: RNA 2',3'-cyclic phosphodiesterase [Desulfuromonas sp.]|nr:MAG: RNA 2',3'-cyclic phosphodiesterase [Desulfuromonas sp.]
MMPEKPVRCFIAIPLSEPVKAAITSIQRRLQQDLPGTRWTKPETMHLTLHFFGELGYENLDKAGSVMVSIGSLFRPFTIALHGLGAFPSPDRARVFWLGIKSASLTMLHTHLLEKLASAGFTCEERPFEPHITLGRSRRGMQKAGHILSHEGDMFAGEMTVDRLVLYESELLSSGAVHHPRQTIHFTAD